MNGPAAFNLFISSPSEELEAGRANGGEIDFTVFFGGQHVRQFQCASPLDVIRRAAATLLDEIDGLMTRWSTRDEKRADDELDELLRFHGEAFARSVFPPEVRNQLASHAREYRVMSIVTDWNEAALWPWEAALIRSSGDDVDSIVPATEFFLGEEYLVVTTQAVNDMRGDLSPTHLVGTKTLLVAHPDALRGAEELGYKTNTRHVLLQRVTELRRAVQGRHVVAISCQSSDSIDRHSSSAAPKRLIGDQNAFRLIVAADGGSLDAGTVRGAGFASRGIVGFMACKAGCYELARTVAHETRGTVLAPYSIIPADIGVRLGESLMSMIATGSGEGTSLADIVRMWRKANSPYGLLFSLYGQWFVNVSGSKNVDSD